MKRKGLIEKNVLGLILAVVLVVLIVLFLGVPLYNLFFPVEERNAKAFMDSLEGKINALEEGEENSFAIVGLGDWILAGWDKSETLKRGGKPNKCFDSSCLCACPSSDNATLSCQGKGHCRLFDFDKVEVRSEMVLYSTELGDARVDVREYVRSTCISLKSKNLLEVPVKKNSQGIEIYKDYGSGSYSRSDDSFLTGDVKDSLVGCPDSSLNEEKDYTRAVKEVGEPTTFFTHPGKI
jgi:hypothetical protein